MVTTQWQCALWVLLPAKSQSASAPCANGSIYPADDGMSNAYSTNPCSVNFGRVFLSQSGLHSIHHSISIILQLHSIHSFEKDAGFTWSPLTMPTQQRLQELPGVPLHISTRAGGKIKKTVWISQNPHWDKSEGADANVHHLPLSLWNAYVWDVPGASKAPVEDLLPSLASRKIFMYSCLITNLLSASTLTEAAITGAKNCCTCSQGE